MTTRLSRSVSASLPLHPYTTRGSTAQGPSTTFTITLIGVLFLHFSFKYLSSSVWLNGVQSVHLKKKNKQQNKNGRFWKPKLWLFWSFAFFLIARVRQWQEVTVQKRRKQLLAEGGHIIWLNPSMWCWFPSVVSGHCLPSLPSCWKFLVFFKGAYVTVRQCPREHTDSRHVIFCYMVRTSV